MATFQRGDYVEASSTLPLPVGGLFSGEFPGIITGILFWIRRTKVSHACYLERSNGLDLNISDVKSGLSTFGRLYFHPLIVFMSVCEHCCVLRTVKSCKPYAYLSS